MSGGRFVKAKEGQRWSVYTIDLSTNVRPHSDEERKQLENEPRKALAIGGPSGMALQGRLSGGSGLAGAPDARLQGEELRTE